ncbi:MAG: epoxyqueuosine reductase [Synergistaceae bacterium]|jgi:epoxyqueuosine reductase QueG|nr:epoxyqueuosine reductase [Synergistaceae bacterium]
MNDLVKARVYDVLGELGKNVEFGKRTSLVAFANLAGLANLVKISEHAGEWPVAISIAIALDPAVVARIPGGPHEDYAREYDRVNAILDELGLAVEKQIVERGCAAYAITRERAPYEKNVCRTPFPHKTAARLAGLGWIGKNALLVTPEFGAAIRLTTVLTDAPLICDRPILEQKCGACQKCRDSCPGGAILGRLWSVEIDRDDMVDAQKCGKTTETRGQDLKIRSATCGLCFASCPFTRARSQQSSGDDPQRR